MEDDILTAEQAFQLDVQVAAPDRIALNWTIAPETYLYADKVELSLEGAEDTALGTWERPKGDIKKDSILPDGTTGDVEVYHDQLAIELPLLRGATAPTEVTLVAKYQGCADRGICYPPQTQKLKLSLPEALAAAVLPAAAAADPARPRRPRRSRVDPRARPRRRMRAWSPSRIRSPRSWRAATCG